MQHIVIIGAGQLGSRHLQGLIKLKTPLVLHILDPSEQAIINAKNRMAEVKERFVTHQIISHTSFETLPEQVELAIIATTADVRLKAMKSLCVVSKVRYLILEKVLFQNLQEYNDAKDLLNNHNIKCWVNCSRRAYSGYRQLKDFFVNDQLEFMQVDGGNWGLGCNSIHFLDLLSFLTNNCPSIVCASHLDAKFELSKRPGFIEFYGTLSGQVGTCNFSFTSSENRVSKHLIMIRGQEKSIIIDETLNSALKIFPDKHELVEFIVPYQSSLTTIVVESILDKGTCNLSSYEESMSIHTPLIRALAQKQYTNQHAMSCSIT